MPISRNYGYSNPSVCRTAFKQISQKKIANTVSFNSYNGSPSDMRSSIEYSRAVAEELTNLSRSHQVLCITHQPIIAAMADQYFYIEKIQQDNSTRIKVSSLNYDERTIAISKLASGLQDDQDSINFANKLLQQAQEYKNCAQMPIFNA